MQTLLKNWNFMRVLRLALGIFIILQGIQGKDWLFITLGTIFSLLPIFNIGCCAAGNCNTRTINHKPNNNEITYEEVK